MFARSSASSTTAELVQHIDAAAIVHSRPLKFHPESRHVLQSVATSRYDRGAPQGINSSTRMVDGMVAAGRTRAG
jgi:hypothetical protein